MPASKDRVQESAEREGSEWLDQIIRKIEDDLGEGPVTSGDNPLHRVLKINAREERLAAGQHYAYDVIPSIRAKLHLLGF